MQIYSFSPFGYEGSLVTVEVDLRRGIPSVDIVGLAGGAVKESRERMQAAIRNSGFNFPSERVLISLSPADMKKEGAGFDLPIAVGVLFAGNNHSSFKIDLEKESVLIMGELELSGKIRCVRGVHAAVSTAVSYGIKYCIVPESNKKEAEEVSGIKVFGAETLENAFDALKDESVFSEREKENTAEEFKDYDNYENIGGVFFNKSEEGMEFSEIIGQRKLIRALQLAAAGGHNLIAIGAPGCGKTMALKKAHALFPILTVKEAQSVTRIYSIAGQLPPDKSLIRIPPFRMPHQTASIEGICGGGVHCRPGEISLAHNGILFLDEAAEFKSSVLQMLRVPLESRCITLARAGRSTVFPANFQLFMAANPCPCGNFGSVSKVCLCSTRSIELYWKKISAPLLDRLDIRVQVENENIQSIEKYENAGRVITTQFLRKGIAKAVLAQRNRQGKKNADLTPSEIKDNCKIDDISKEILNKAVVNSGFSPRAAACCLKIARTAADISGSVIIKPEHVKEAVSFRCTFNNFMDMQTG